MKLGFAAAAGAVVGAMLATQVRYSSRVRVPYSRPAVNWICSTSFAYESEQSLGISAYRAIRWRKGRPSAARSCSFVGFLARESPETADMH